MEADDHTAETVFDAHISRQDLLAWWRAALYANDASSVDGLVQLGHAAQNGDPSRTIGFPGP